MPTVSVVVPARDAEATLAHALASLSAQTESSFEAIVVDDGSRDGTAEVALAHAASDPRVRVLRGRARGVSGARNRGIEVARGEWMLFLDADDWIEPDALARLLREARSERRPDAVVCAWARVGPGGERLATHAWNGPREQFDAFATTCAFAIHSCLVRRDLIIRLGGFDESLVTCEDWDLWQRLARTGARFAVIDTCLAFYRMRLGAASAQGRRMLLDGLEVIRRGHSPDPRVTDADPRYAAGRDHRLMARTRIECMCYAAGLLLGAGEDPRPLFAELDASDVDPGLDPRTVAACIVDALPLASCCLPEELAGRWSEVGRWLDPFLTELEGRAAPGLAVRSRRQLDRLVLDRTRGPFPLTLGSMHVLRVDLEEPLPDVRTPASVDRLICTAELRGQPLGKVELPVCDGRVPAAVLADALAAEVFWPLLGHYFAREAHDADGWERFLRELWGLPDWPEARFYDPVADAPPAAPRAAVGGWVSVELSEELPDVAAAEGLCVEVTVGGAPVGVVELPAGRRRVRAQELRAAITSECGLELALVAVREVLLGRPLPVATPLRELLREAASGGEPLFEDDAVLVPRWPGAIRGPASRRAALPARAGRPVLYEPALQQRPYIPRGARPAPAAVSTAETTHQLPVLMYHRVAERGPHALRRYRVSPRQFEEHLHALSEWGYTGTTLDQWCEACERRRPLPGRAVLITFDDGYLDFAESAWPLLERYGFSATLFVVAGEAGGTNRWDDGDQSLLGWDELRELRERGVRIGSHTLTHPALSGLSNAEVVRELVGSRERIEDELGGEVTALAYPYGDLDGAIAHLAGACGYSFGLTCEPMHAELTGSPLQLPRFEVEGDDGVAQVARKLSPY